MNEPLSVFRPVAGRLTVRGPAWWIRSRGLARYVEPSPYAGCLEVPRSWFRGIVRDGSRVFGSVRVIADHKVTLSACDVRCARAIGTDCQCACLGINHNDASGGSVVMEQVGATTLLETGVERREYTVRDNRATLDPFSRPLERTRT